MVSKKLSIIADKKNGSLVFPSKNNPNWGSLALRQECIKVTTKGGRAIVESNVVTAFQEGPLNIIEMLANEYLAMGTKIPGAIFVKEYVESNIPAEYKKSTTLDRNIKRLSSDVNAPELTLGGERIFRFTEYHEDTDRTTNKDAFDLPVQHDNIEAVAAFNATRPDRANSEALKNAAKTTADAANVDLP